MKATVAITVKSDPKYLGMIRDATARFSIICGLDEDEAGRVKLAVDEACSNVIKYAYEGDLSKSINVKYAHNRKAIVIMIEDSGKKANPELIRGRDLDDVRPGGLGMHFISRVFDDVRFDERKVRGNRLVLTKRMGGGNES